ncbi:uroporphyrinogen-III C-methyltransferase [Tepidimonas charontis]|uniref:uroporphyrinogen-III C-methyltransferase n=1 Tax=Tepidimonas charontis TaxID=2267262 RepID=A0A554XDK5_9BURK|nr:uroporphyrinogen-III C-methyltransferase [Tepidimonas charontis]TSE33917.1 Uroporphyrinogen-III C-methyltransferase [Tepidimonas charontis]
MATVAFVGAGPGAADLITVRGARWLARADVVLADALADPALREHAPDADWIDVGKRGYGPATEQAVIHALLLRYAARCACVVRLKGGDPSVFGRLEEELAVVRAAGHETVVVPGVTAALAAAADAQRPLTRRGRGRSVALTTAMTREHALCAGRHADSEVFYMAGTQLPALARQLAAAGWPATTPLSVVSRAGWPDAIHTQHTLATLAQACVLHRGRPTVVIVGAAASALAPAHAGSAAAWQAASASA